MSVPLSWSTQATTNANGAFTLTLPNMLSAGQVAIIDSLTISASVALTGAVAELRQSGTPIGWISGRGQYGPFRTYAGEIIEVLMTGGPATTRVSVTVRGQRFLPHEACPLPGESESEFDRAAAGMGPGLGISEPDAGGGAAPESLFRWNAGSYYSWDVSNALFQWPFERLSCVPFPVHREQSFDQFGTRVSSVGDASRRVRLGIYQNKENEPGFEAYPGALFLDAGLLGGLDTIGNKFLDVTPFSLSPGLWWVASVVQEGAGALVNGIGYNVHGTASWPFLGLAPSPGLFGSGNVSPGFFTDAISGALPNPFPAGVTRTGAGNSAPKAFLRAV